MTASIEIKTTGLRNVARASMLCGALFVFGTAAHADALSAGAKNYKPFAVEHIGKAVHGAKELQAAVKAKDAKKAQAAWIKSRKGWEAAEPITGEFFSKLDEAIDAWPDAKQGYHAIEAAGIDAGIQADSREMTAAPLAIVRTTDLEAAQRAVERAGGVITRAAFDFPGGRRFHFREPGGNEMAVWIARP